MEFIKDEDFIRGNSPMTKEEVRILSISKLGINEKSIVLDIGAGTGSVSIQLAKICNKGKVISIEKNEESIDLINANIKKFKVNNIELIYGDAIKLFNNMIDEFDGIFIGGSGGNIEQMIQFYDFLLKSNKKMVLNCITLSNLYNALKVLKEYNYNIDVTQIAISKSKGDNYMMIANNPIFIVAAEKK
jgi:cobalt-precorrin-6B (C15)-methyltransferase